MGYARAVNEISPNFRFYNRYLENAPILLVESDHYCCKVNRWPVTLRVFANQAHWWLSKQASQFQVDSPNSREISSTALLTESHRAALLTVLCVNIVLLSAAGKMEPTPNYFHFQDALNETSTLKCLTKLWWRRASERCMQHAIIMLWYGQHKT